MCNRVQRKLRWTTASCGGITSKLTATWEAGRRAKAGPYNEAQTRQKVWGASAPYTTGLRPLGSRGSSAQHPGRGLARSPVFSPPPSAASSQTTRRSVAALCPLVRGPFHFHPALRSSPIICALGKTPPPRPSLLALRPPPAAASAAASSFPTSSVRGEIAGARGAAAAAAALWSRGRVAEAQRADSGPRAPRSPGSRSGSWSRRSCPGW